MSVVRTTIAVVGVAIAVSRHPLVRAGIRHAPKLMTPRMRRMAADMVLDTAYAAGVAARRVVPRKLI
jgi:hypothetical protein